jgi:hypothetical protein
MLPAPRYNRPGQPERYTNLTACWSRKELAQSDQICIAALGQPLPSRHKLIAEVTQMGNWAAEGCQAKSEENQKDSPGAVIIPGSIVHGQILIAGLVAIIIEFRYRNSIIIATAPCG